MFIFTIKFKVIAKQVRAETQGRNVEAGGDAETMQKVPLIRLLVKTCSACFLTPFNSGLPARGKGTIEMF